jgi:hypothetical protein
MKQRCHNPNAHQYKDYGGRGITVCDEWRDNFSCFVYWALSSGYKDNLTIDRIDNNKGYSPDNCKFSTMLEQERNKRVPIINKSGYKGVYYDARRNNWRAIICANYKQIAIGRFKTFEEAKVARIKYEQKLWKREEAS